MGFHPPADADLIALVRRLRDSSGEEGPALALDQALRPRLIRYFSAGPWPRDEGQDLAQKTLLQVFRNLPRLERVDYFLPWLFAIARNIRLSALETWRKRSAVEEVGIEEAPGEPAFPAEGEARAEHEARIAALEEALTRLPPQQRQCLLLQVGRDMSYAQIAATLRLSPHTVRNHIAQAKRSLQRRLAGFPGKASR